MIMSAVFVAIAVAIVVLAAKARQRDPFDPLRGMAPHGQGVADRLDAGAASSDRSALRVHLDDWVTTGLIDPATARAIERHELTRTPERTSRIPLAAEAVGYLGGGLVIAALTMVIGNNWEDLGVAARLAVLAAPTTLAAAGGWWIGRADEEPLQRLGSLLWALTVAGVAATAGEVWYDVIHDADPPEAGTILFPAAAAAVAAGVLWWLRRQALQVLVLFATTVATVAGVVEASRAEGSDASLLAMGLALLALAAAWTTGGLLEHLTPSLPVLIVGPALALVAAQILRDENVDLGLWVGIGVAVTLLAVGAAHSAVSVLLVGTVGLFQWTPQIALHYLGDRLGAEITLALIGLLLLALAGSMIRLWPWLRTRTG
ncbi:MAG: DUF2157 domain-containing protein [Acidimicrobiales bacterium]